MTLGIEKCLAFAGKRGGQRGCRGGAGSRGVTGLGWSQVTGEMGPLQAVLRSLILCEEQREATDGFRWGTWT